MEETIKVSDDGLHDLATHCDTAASAISSGGTLTTPGPQFQASSAAVGHGHTLVAAAAATLAARATVTGTKLRAAAASYTNTDGASADQLAAVGRSIEV